MGGVAEEYKGKEHCRIIRPERSQYHGADVAPQQHCQATYCENGSSLSYEDMGIAESDQLWAGTGKAC
jgi:hypothetical protein